MRIYSDSNFRIGITTTKTLFKIENLKTNEVITISKSKFKKAYNLNNDTLINLKLILNGTLFFLDTNLSDLNSEIKRNKKRFENIKDLKLIAENLRDTYFKEYYKTSLFKNLLNI